MSEHWIVENTRWGRSGLRVVTDPSAAAQYRTWRGWEVTGPFIEASDAEALAHAVSASLTHGEQSPLATALSAYLDKHPWSDL